MTPQALTAAGYHFGELKSSINAGVSEPAIDLRKLVNDAFDHFLESSYNQKEFYPVYFDIRETVLEHSKPNWDGYDAKPLSKTLIDRACRFLSAFDDILESEPEITPEPDGELAIEWYGVNGEIFSISIGDHNEINYAGTFLGNKKVHGVDNIDSPDKEILSNYIQKIRSTKTNTRR